MSKGQDELDLFYMSWVYEEAAKSPDPSTQNGAVVVGEDGIVCGLGYNAFPNGVEYKKERWERPGKYQWIEHAERQSLYDAALCGMSTNKATMYAVWAACQDCARGIIQSGIKELVTHRFEGCEGNDTWKASISVAFQMLKESGVKVRFWEGVVGRQIRFSGKLVER